MHVCKTFKDKQTATRCVTWYLVYGCVWLYSVYLSTEIWGATCLWHTVSPFLSHTDTIAAGWTCRYWAQLLMKKVRWDTLINGIWFHKVKQTEQYMKTNNKNSSLQNRAKYIFLQILNGSKTTESLNLARDCRILWRLDRVLNQNKV